MTKESRPIVLWIEDKQDLEMREVKVHLEDTGKYDLRYAASVVEARKALDAFGSKIGVVLLDIILPIGEDVVESTDMMLRAGIDLYFDRLKKLNVPVIILTCRNDEEAIAVFRNEPVRFLNKPVFPEEVEETIDSVPGKGG
jgi:CheY-like chemotaxis protein